MRKDVIERYLARMVYNLACDVIPLLREQIDTCGDKCRLVSVANRNFERRRLVAACCSSVEVEVDCCHSRWEFSKTTCTDFARIKEQIVALSCGIVQFNGFF